ncbi:MAG: DUF6242 domain-containing protein [Muribaculaceae bacterium]
MNRRFPIYFLLCILIASIVSCKDSKIAEEPTVTSSNVAVTSFKLAKDTSVLVNLDSIFFTIDLNNAEIFNADSLPKGSKIKKLVLSIGLPTLSSATLRVIGGTVMKDSTIDYAKNPKDSIDFTGRVTLEVVSQDKLSKRTYTLKVNVHNMKPDSLYWNQLARRDLPSIGEPLAQKTVEYGSKVYCFIKESGRYAMSITDNVASNKWTKTIVNLGFTPNVNSFTTTDNALYMLSDAGALYTSVDGLSWSACGVSFYSLLGSYGNKLLGIVKEGANYKHDEYPRQDGYTPVLCDDAFPIRGTSPMITFTTEWSVSPQVMTIGGVDKAGKVVGDAWGFDGTTWAKISNTPIAPGEGVALFPYFTFKTNKNRWVATKHTTWIAIGGRDQAGKVTKNVYISLDGGIHWKKGDNLLQLPEYMPAFSNAQAIVSNSTLTARSYDNWEAISSVELPVWYMVSKQGLSRGVASSWDCPYIYMFGGEAENGMLMNNIWKGVLNRLSFKPVI